MTQKSVPIPFNEGDMTFLTGFLLGTGKLHVNPLSLPYTFCSISFYSSPPTLVFRTLDARSLKPLSLMTHIPIETTSDHSFAGSLSITHSHWIRLILKEWIAHLKSIAEIDPNYDPLVEFPELYYALQLFYTASSTSDSPNSMT